MKSLRGKVRTDVCDSVWAGYSHMLHHTARYHLWSKLRNNANLTEYNRRFDSIYDHFDSLMEQHEFT